MLLTKLPAISANAIEYVRAASANVPKVSDKLFIAGSNVFYIIYSFFYCLFYF